MTSHFYTRYIPPTSAKAKAPVQTASSIAVEEPSYEGTKKRRKEERKDANSRKKRKTVDQSEPGLEESSANVNGAIQLVEQKEKRVKHRKKHEKHKDDEVKENDHKAKKRQKREKREEQTNPAEEEGEAEPRPEKKKEKKKHKKKADVLAADTLTNSENANAIGPTSQPNSEPDATKEDSPGLNDTQNEKPPPKRKKRHKPATPEPDDAEAYTQKHSKILSKYTKSAKPPPTTPHQDDIPPKSPSPAPNPLAPIPRPAPDKTYATPNPTSALPSWLRAPTTISQTTTHPFASLPIPSSLLAPLRKSGFDTTLPIQSGVLPHLLPTIDQHPGDVAVSAATGSGKTLAYILPIMQDLRALPIPRLRALIVVPTRELVDQVRKVCAMFTPATRLHVGTALGTQGLQTEQQALIEKTQRYDPDEHDRIALNMHAIVDESAGSDEHTDDDSEPGFDHADFLGLWPEHVPAYNSKVDILITTPGRLVEHIKHTRGFTLAELRWLVIDEADRLLDQSFQEWAEVVKRALDKPSDDDNHDIGMFTRGRDSWARSALAPIWPGRGKIGPRKVLLSASMTRDLEKLGMLGLVNPKLIVVEGVENRVAGEEDGNVQGTMRLPERLEEYAVPVGDGSEKPLFLLKLLELLLSGVHIPGTLHQSLRTPAAPVDENAEEQLDDASASASDSETSSITSLSPSLNSTHSSPSSSSAPPPTTQIPDTPSLTLIFTSTNESAARLTTLLSHLSPTHIRPLITTLTKSTSSSKTRKLLSSFTAPGSAQRILIATDRASRGLDIPGLTDVVNYDVPHSVTGYVHRVGRTARAGQAGKAWTLLGSKEAGWFWHVVARSGEKRKSKGQEESEKIERTGEQKVRKVRLEGVREEGRVEMYETALGKLKDEVIGE